MGKGKEGTGKAIHFTDVEAKVFGDEAPGVTIRWVIDEENDGAPHFVLRVIEIAPGGHTPDHIHTFEHENFVIEGTGRVRLGDEWQDVSFGSVVFVPAGLRHTYQNTGAEPFKFLCSIPVSRLRGE